METIEMTSFDPKEIRSEGYYLFKTDATPKKFNYITAYLKQSGDKMSSDIRNQQILLISKKSLS